MSDHKCAPRADEFTNVGEQDPIPSLRMRLLSGGSPNRPTDCADLCAYFAQQLDESAAPSEGRRRSSAKYTGQKPVMPL